MIKMDHFRERANIFTTSPHLEPTGLQNFVNVMQDTAFAACRAILVCQSFGEGSTRFLLSVQLLLGARLMRDVFIEICRQNKKPLARLPT
jgi:hypothetical protein